MTMIEVPAPPLIDPSALGTELLAAGLGQVQIALTTADVGTVRVFGDDLAEVDTDAVATVVASHVPPPSVADRLAALEDEVRSMRNRAAAEAAKSTPTAKSVAAAIAATDR